jgi:hypothetical protein
MCNTSDGIIAHLAKECGRNVHDRHVLDVTCEPFEKETEGANPPSVALNDDPGCTAKNAADLEATSGFLSACRSCTKAIPHTRNTWVCYDLTEKRIVATHYS